MTLTLTDRFGDTVTITVDNFRRVTIIGRQNDGFDDDHTPLFKETEVLLEVDQAGELVGFLDTALYG